MRQKQHHIAKLKQRMAKLCRVVIMCLIVFTIAIPLRPQTAYALGCCGGCCACYEDTPAEDAEQWVLTYIEVNLQMFLNLQAHQRAWFRLYWDGYFEPLFTRMGNQLTAVGTQQLMVIGMFMDAKEQMETQRLLQEMQAQAHKDYHPSIGMCEFATRVKSLAATERKGEVNALILSERSTDRFMNNYATGARTGAGSDASIRHALFTEEFCSSFDNNNSLSFMCGEQPSSSLSGDIKNRFNRDIDYQRAVEFPWTIDFDFTQGGNPSENDEEILALANNLYGFNGFDPINAETAQYDRDREITDAHDAIMHKRSTIAKTKVAENSFNALMAMKGAGTAESRRFIEAYLYSIGIPVRELEDFIGENPSYHAQMEILTKLAYQTPIFYTNLYDKPVNIERKAAAMQAVGLIQKFDLLKSYLRTEANLAVLLELSVMRLQRQVQNNIDSFN